MPKNPPVQMSESNSLDGDPDHRFSWGVRRQLLMLLHGALLMGWFTIGAAFAPRGGIRFTLFDDAMVSMTYARTLVDTGEWVWFPGADRVQGFTNPLWTLFMAFVHAIGLEGSYAALAVSLTGIALLLLAGLAVGYLVSRGLGSQGPGPWAALIAGATVPLVYPLVYWTLRGMEVWLLALLSVFAAIAAWGVTESGHEGRSSKWPLIALLMTGAIGVAVRLDFVAILVPLLLTTFLLAPNRKTRLILVTAVGIPIAVVITGILALQFSYFGDWFPNTYRLKVEGFTTGERLSRGLLATGKVVPLLLIAVASLVVITAIKTRVEVRRLSFLLASVGIAPIAYSIWTGGDAWDDFQMLNRYVSVGTPALIALLFLAAGLYLQQGIRDFTGRPLKILVLLVAFSAAGA